MPVINTRLYTMQLALLIAAIYVAEFCYLDIGVGIAFMKLVMPLALVLFAVHFTWAALPLMGQGCNKTTTVGSHEIGLRRLLYWNFALTYLNMVAMILRDYIYNIDGIPVHFIFVATIMVFHIVVGLLIIKLVFDNLGSLTKNKKP